MRIESRIGRSESSAQEIYAFVTDFNNFKDLLPEGKVTQWESFTDQCSFVVEPVGRIGLRIIEKEAHSLIKIASVPEFSSHQFTIWVQLKEVAEKDTRVKITIEPQVNRMLLPMIKGPLKQFVDSLVDRIEKHSF